MTIQIELAERTALLKEKTARTTGLELELVSDYDLSDIRLVLKNGSKVVELKSNERKIPVPEELAFAGELQIKVSARIRGTVIKSWNVEPLILIDAEDGFDVYGTITELQNKVVALQTQLKDLKEIVDQMSKDLTDVYDGLEC